MTALRKTPFPHVSDSRGETARERATGGCCRGPNGSARAFGLPRPRGLVRLLNAGGHRSGSITNSAERSHMGGAPPSGQSAHALLDDTGARGVAQRAFSVDG